jgi:hypothetical protein
VTVRFAGAPGNTTPLPGATVNQELVPGDAENETGPPLVVNRTVWDAGLAGGDVKLRVFVNVKVGRGAVTTSFTLAVPAILDGTVATGVKVTAAVYVPIASPVGFTCKLTFAGKVPVSGLAVIQSPFAGTVAIVVEYVGAPALDLTDTIWVAGKTAPCR